MIMLGGKSVWKQRHTQEINEDWERTSVNKLGL